MQDNAQILYTTNAISDKIIINIFNKYCIDFGTEYINFILFF